MLASGPSFRQRVTLVVTLALCSAAPISVAYAQLENQTGIADPGRAQRDLQRSLETPRPSPDIQVKGITPQDAPPGAENIRFTLNSVDVKGATAFTADELARVYSNRIGSEMSLADLYGVAAELTLKYRNAGYILTQVVVPPQTIEGGHVKLQVVEGFLNAVSVQAADGDGEIAATTIREYANQLKTGGPVNVKTLERQLLLISDLPGVSARSIISPAANAPGGADMVIIVERDSFEGMVGVDNYGSRYLGPVQLSAAGTLNSMLGMNEAITGQMVVAPDDGLELAYGSLGYEQPVGRWGTKVGVSGSLTETEPGYDLRPFDVEGRSVLFTLKATHPFIRTRSSNLIGRALFDWRNVRSENNIEPTRHDRVRALRAGMTYDFLDRLLGVAVNAVDIEVSKGLGIFGASDEGDANMTRAAGDPQFTKAVLSVQRLQRLTGSVNLLLAGSGQLSSGALLSSEEFGVGGISNGRGYDPSEVVGDEGISGKAELQWTNPYAINSPYLEKYQLYSFYDVGTVWNDDATTSAAKRDSVASAGAGLRLNFASSVEGDFAIAVPLTRDVQTRGDTDPTVYFSLQKRF